MGMLLRSPYPEATGFDPLTIPGLQALWLLEAGTLWQDASATTAASALNDPVARVDDVSGNGRHLLVYGSDNARRPLLKTAAQNGRVGLRFDGSDDALTVAVGAWTQPLQVFIVYKSISVGGANANDIVASGAGGSGITAFFEDSTPRVGIYAGGEFYYNGGSLAAAATLFTFAWATGSSYIRSNGGLLVSGDAGNVFQPEGLTIGAAGWNGGRAVNIELYAAGVVKAPVTGTDLADAEGYFMTTWGL